MNAIERQPPGAGWQLAITTAEGEAQTLQCQALVGADGDVLMWDNFATLHRRDAFDDEARRILHRTQIKGDSAPATA